MASLSQLNFLLYNPDPFPTLNFILFQTQRVCRQVSVMMKIAESSPNGSITLWEKEKLLVTSNFSFSHHVFTSLVLQTQNKSGKLSQDMPVLPQVVKLGHASDKIQA